MESILDYCREQREQGAKIMLLIKAATSDGWWPEDADCIQFISGRIGFEAPNWYTPADPVKDKPSSSGFASAVVIFDRDWKWERRPIERTLELSEIIKSAMPAAALREKQHPAKRSFQAIRIAVNEELEAVSELLEAAAGGTVAEQRCH